MQTFADIGFGGWLRWLGLAVALYVLDLAFVFHNLWPSLWIRPGIELSVELAVLVLALALWSEARRPPGRRLFAALALLLTLFALGRYAQVTAPAMFGRGINLFWDAQHVPDVAAMLAEANPWWRIAAMGLGSILLLGLIYAVLRWALERVRGGLGKRTPRRLLAGSAAAVVVAYAVDVATGWQALDAWFARPVSVTYARQAAFVWAAANGRGMDRLRPTTHMASDLGRLQGADLVLVFLESYGAVTFENPALDRSLSASRKGLADAVAQTGRGAVSAFVGSPTFGGYSWLAHASLLAGVQVTENPDYDLLLTQRRETLVQRFGRAGYRTVALMPGLRRNWPEGAFYGYDRILDARALDYQGPAFGWWRIPDQFALAAADRMELSAGGGRPRFIVFPTISSHMPFRPTPPYQPDWVRLRTPEPFAGTPVADALKVLPDWGNLANSYAHAIAYAYTWLAGYLRYRSDRDFVLVVVGDHQPPARVLGRGPWDVPVHVITRRSAILGGLAAEGFARGVTPERPSLGAMAQLGPLLLRAFDSTSTGRQDQATAAGLADSPSASQIPKPPHAQ